MEISQRSKIAGRKKNKKIGGGGSNGNLGGFFFLVSSPFALILTIIFCLLGIKTPFWSERGTSRYPGFKGYISVFFFLAFYVASVIIILYILSFLLRSLFQSKQRSQRKKAGKYLLLLLTNQLLINLFFSLLGKQRTKSNSIMIMLISFLLIILNSIFIHYLFSKPAMKLLMEKYPYYFPKVFYQETKLIMKVDGMKFKKTQTTEGAIIITLTLVNFGIISLFFGLKMT